MYVRVRTTEITLGITGLLEILGRKTGLKNPIGNPLLILQQTELFYEENV